MPKSQSRVEYICIYAEELKEPEELKEAKNIYICNIHYRRLKHIYIYIYAISLSEVENSVYIGGIHYQRQKNIYIYIDIGYIVISGFYYEPLPETPNNNIYVWT